ncbi:MAG: glycosyltransferase family 39 protein [Candidatus Micrarchaeota archaeon]
MVLLLSALVFLVAGRPTLTPDEGVYAFEAKQVSQGISLETLDAFKNRLVHIFSLSVFFSILGPDLGVARLVIFLSTLACVALVFLIARKFGTEKQAFFAALFFALMPIVITLSQGLLSEMPSTLFSLLAVWLFLQKGRKLAFLGGISAAIGFLIREQSIVLPFAFVLAVFVFRQDEGATGLWKRDWLKYIAFCFASIAVIGVWTFFFGFNYLESYLLNVEYVRNVAPSFIPGFVMIPFSLAVGGGAAVVLALIALVFCKRDNVLWLWFIVSAAFMLVVPRVEVRYALTALIPLAIIASGGAEWLWKKQKIALVLLALLSIVGGWAMSSYWHTLNNPASFYETADFIKQNGGAMVSQICFDYEALNYGLQIKCIENSSPQDFNQGAVFVEHSNHVVRPEWMENCTFTEIFKKNDGWLVIKHSIGVYEVECAPA